MACEFYLNLNNAIFKNEMGEAFTSLQKDLGNLEGAGVPGAT